MTTEDLELLTDWLAETGFTISPDEAGRIDSALLRDGFSRFTGFHGETAFPVYSAEGVENPGSVLRGYSRQHDDGTEEEFVSFEVETKGAETDSEA